MVTGNQDDEALAGDQQRVQCVGQVIGSTDQREIQAPVTDLLDEGVRAVLRQRDPDIRVRDMEG
jgi:hypothetical protein